MSTFYFLFLFLFLINYCTNLNVKIQFCSYRKGGDKHQKRKTPGQSDKLKDLFIVVNISTYVKPYRYQLLKREGQSEPKANTTLLPPLCIFNHFNCKAF